MMNFSETSLLCKLSLFEEPFSVWTWVSWYPLAFLPALVVDRTFWN